MGPTEPSAGAGVACTLPIAAAEPLELLAPSTSPRPTHHPAMLDRAAERMDAIPSSG